MVFSLVSAFSIIFSFFLVNFFCFFATLCLRRNEPELFPEQERRVRDPAIHLLRLRTGRIEQLRTEEDLSVLLSTAVVARAVQTHPGHAPSQVRLRHLQVLLQDVQEQELAGLPHVEVPQGRQGAAARRDAAQQERGSPDTKLKQSSFPEMGHSGQCFAKVERMNFVPTQKNSKQNHLS